MIDSRFMMWKPENLDDSFKLMAEIKPFSFLVSISSFNANFILGKMVVLWAWSLYFGAAKHLKRRVDQQYSLTQQQVSQRSSQSLILTPAFTFHYIILIRLQDDELGFSYVSCAASVIAVGAGVPAASFPSSSFPSTFSGSSVWLSIVRTSGVVGIF